MGEFKEFKEHPFWERRSEVNLTSLFQTLTLPWFLNAVTTVEVSSDVHRLLSELRHRRVEKWAAIEYALEQQLLGREPVEVASEIVKWMVSNPQCTQSKRTRLAIYKLSPEVCRAIDALRKAGIEKWIIVEYSLRKLQENKDLDKLAAEINEWKHRTVEKLLEKLLEPKKKEKTET